MLASTVSAATRPKARNKRPLMPRLRRRRAAGAGASCRISLLINPVPAIARAVAALRTGGD